MQRYYMAIAKDGKWACGVVHGKHEWNKVLPVGDFRFFDSFEEADSVARAAARGEYGCFPGQYVNNR